MINAKSSLLKVVLPEIISFISGVVLFFGARSLYPPRTPGMACIDWCPPWGNFDEKLSHVIGSYGVLVGTAVAAVGVIFWIAWLMSRTPERKRRAIGITVLGMVVFFGSIFLSYFILFGGLLGLMVFMGLILMAAGLIIGTDRIIRYFRSVRVQNTSADDSLK